MQTFPRAFPAMYFIAALKHRYNKSCICAKADECAFLEESPFGFRTLYLWSNRLARRGSYKSMVQRLFDINAENNIQGEAHKVLQSNITQTIHHIRKCFRQKFQCSRRPSYWTALFSYRWRR